MPPEKKNLFSITEGLIFKIIKPINCLHKNSPERLCFIFMFCMKFSHENIIALCSALVVVFCHLYWVVNFVDCLVIQDRVDGVLKYGYNIAFLTVWRTLDFESEIFCKFIVTIPDLQILYTVTNEKTREFENLTKADIVQQFANAS